MSELLYAFGIGISFSIGIGAGAFLASLAFKRGVRAANDAVDKHNKMVEERLSKYVEHTDRIAWAVENIAIIKAREDKP